MIVKKFGGTSVGSSENIKKVITIIQRTHADERCIVVVSAFTGVTDQLLSLCRVAVSKESYEQSLSEFENRHLDVVRELISVAEQPRLRAQLNELFSDLSNILRGISLIGECSDATRDAAVSFGERLSATCIAAALNDSGLPAHALDTRLVVRTDAAFGNAHVDFDATYDLIRAYVQQHDGLIVATGFIAATADGRTTTLGRGGSDYTASLLGAALRASAIEIWTDVDGVMTADPRKVPAARVVDQMTYEEAMELSYFGAKVIYYPTIIPARAHHIPLLIKNTFAPDDPGTRLSNEQSSAHVLVSAITSLSPIVLLQVKGIGLIGSRGMASRVFDSLARANVNIILISQASSEYSICIGITAEEKKQACAALNNEFEYEMSKKLIEPIVAENESAIVAVVGAGMRQTPGIAGRVFSAVGKHGISVRAIAQGSSELNISLVVPEKDKDEALRAIHDEFFYNQKI